MRKENPENYRGDLGDFKMNYFSTYWNHVRDRSDSFIINGIHLVLFLETVQVKQVEVAMRTD